MLKLVQGVINFHEKVLPELSAQFADLAAGQSPDTVMVACMDSRVVPNLFASTNPGDLFVVRNPGNLIPPFDQVSEETHLGSEAAAIEIALQHNVKDMIICGHSRCAAMAALLSDDVIKPGVRRWIRHALGAKRQLDLGSAYDRSLPLPDQLSQLSVMAQLHHLQSYPDVADHLATGALRLHGWWFDIGSGNVFNFEPEENRFVVIDRVEGARILSRLG